MTTQIKKKTQNSGVSSRAVRDLSILLAGGPYASKGAIREAHAAIKMVLGDGLKKMERTKDFGEKIHHKKRRGYELEK